MRWLAALALLLHAMPLSAAESEQGLLLSAADRALAQGATAQAVTLYSRALEGPALPAAEQLAAYNNRGAAFRRLGQHERAAADYERALALAPEDTDLLFNKAIALLADHRFEEAVAALGAVPRLRSDASALYLRGLAELGRGEPDRAVQNLTEAIALDARTAEFFYARGRAYTSLKRHDLAIEDFDSALALSPELTPAIFGLGHARSSLGQHLAAIEDFTAAIARLPDEAAPYRGRAEAHRRLGRYDLAIADYSRALALAPDDSASYHGRARARQSLGSYDAALSDYGEAVRLNPNLAAAYKERASVRFYLGQFSEAGHDFQRSLRLNPHDVYAVLWLYLSRQRSGLDGRAELARHAERLDMTRWPAPVVALFLGEAGPEDVLEAVQHEDERRQRQRECEGFFYLGEYRLLEGDLEDAAEFFRRSLAAGITTYMEHAGAEAELDRLAL